MNNERSQANAPTFNFTKPGTYRVVLSVLFGNSIVEVEKDISIYGVPVLKLTASKKVICKPEEISFNLTSDITLSSINWDFGDGTVLSGNGGLSSLSHLFNQFSDNSVQAKVISNQGCTSVVKTVVSLQRPTAEVSTTSIGGCIPVNVGFKANVNVNTGSSVSVYNWSFKDGSPLSSGIVDSNFHSFSQVGTFKPSVSIVTSDGCTNIFDFPSITVIGSPPKAKISALNDTICASERAIFYELNGQATSYIWEISNNEKIENSRKEFSYKFNRPGSYKVKLTPEAYGCVGTPDSMVIEITGVSAAFSFNNSCSNKNQFSFRNISRGRITDLRWNFSDGSQEEKINRPVHLFPPSGEFPVILYVEDSVSSCSDTVRTTIYTALPILIPTDSFVCLKGTASMQVSNSYKNLRVAYNWELGGKKINTSSLNSVQSNLVTPGTFKNLVVISNGGSYCPDTLVQPFDLRVGSPKANFHAPKNICIQDSFPFVDSSIGTSIFEKIISWKWHFGNGISSNLKNPGPIQFNSTGDVKITLSVSDQYGCSDSTEKSITVRGLPLLGVATENQKVCAGQDVNLIALAVTSVQWTPASEVNCSTCERVIVNPIKPTTYFVSTTDEFGCYSEQSISLDIWEQFTLPQNLLKDTSICPGGMVSLDLKINDKIISWSPANEISEPSKPAILVKPLETTRYTALISDSARCFTQSVSATVEVSPIPVIDMGPDLLLPANTPFTLRPTYSGANIASYSWQPAGLLSCSNCPYPSGVAIQQSIYKVEVVSDKGCMSSDSIQLRIQAIFECDPKNIWMPTAFSPNNDGLNDTYYPRTNGMKEIKRFAIYNGFGQLVFQRNNFKPNDNSLGWNGEFNGKKQSTGGFVYVVEATCDIDGATITKKGNFIIVK